MNTRSIYQPSLRDTLNGIHSTDPRFQWLAKEMAVEPDRRLMLASFVYPPYVGRPLAKDQRTELKTHLRAMLADMRGLSLAEELFDVVAPCVQESSVLSVLLRRLGWRGEHWYTEQEGAFALGSNVAYVRAQKEKLVRQFRRGPVWAPVLFRSAAVIQELVPLSNSQVCAACGLEDDGMWTINLWGFLQALDLFDIEHNFVWEPDRYNPTISCDDPVDFGIPRSILAPLVDEAERRIQQAAAEQVRQRQAERIERQKYLDPWEVRTQRQSRIDDVGFSLTDSLHWFEIDRDSPLRAEPDFDYVNYGGPLVLSRKVTVPDPPPRPERSRRS